MTAEAVVRSLDVLDSFTIPPDLEASRPPESRGMARDEVRLMVSGPDGIRHRRFHELTSELSPGDLVVVNTSATLPASVIADQDLVIHFSTELNGGRWVVEPRRLSGATSLPYEDPQPGRVALPGGGSIQLLAPYPMESPKRRLWLADLDLGRPVPEYLTTWGRPIRYRHTDGPYPIEAYQTVFAVNPGSAEMPSAGRPFSERLITSLVARGIAVAPLILHTGVSSLESGEPPYPEWFEIPESTAALVNHAKKRGGRVIAVGTTVVRALETSADSNSVSHPARTWTDLVIAVDHRMRVVDGLITGWHEPASTHLALLESMAGRSLLGESYQRALECGYLWHEFGDSHLILRY